MIPNCDEILRLAEEYNTIPVCREIYADVVTPITLLRRIAQKSRRFYLLESIEGGEKWGRYSFLGYDPVLRVVYRNGEAVTEMADGAVESQGLTAAPYDAIRNILKNRRSPKIKGLPPFTGGFVGYFSYAMISSAEPTLKLDHGDGNDFDLMLFDKVIAYDHLKQKIAIVVNMQTGDRRTETLMAAYGNACREIEAIAGMILDDSPLPVQKAGRAAGFASSVSKEEYCRKVERTKEYIRNGDIFQAVISRQFSSPFEGSLMGAYRVLRTTNPSPYMVYMNIDGDEIISASPETLVRLQDGRLTTFPVAGSRPRGATPEEDRRLETELMADEKELAEHNMLVDLGRNDIGRLAKFGTVEVTEYQMIHKYSKIMHICSQVEGDIRPDCDACAAVEALLPAGTLSGAPKIRACQIIEELEGTPRGIYGGALGYLDFTGNLDVCIAIRMAVKQNGRVTVQAGGGIVADSVPEREYEETAAKAQAVITAVLRGNEVNQV